MSTVGSPGYPSVVSVGRILRRRMVIVIVTTVVVVGLSLVFSLRQAAVYEASAQVLLNYQNLATGLAGIQDLPTQGQDPARVAATQTQVAMSPAVAQPRRARRRTSPASTIGVVPSSASVTAGHDSDTLNFGSRYSDPQIAARLANLHAREYIASRQQLDTSALVAARKELESADRRSCARRPARDTALLTKLVEREQELRTLEALQTANASLLRPATSAVQVQPKPVRNAVLGLDPWA